MLLTVLLSFAHLPALDLSLSSAGKNDLRSCGAVPDLIGRSIANIFTDVIVEVPVRVVKVLVDDDLLHSELLLHVGFALVQNVFSQDDGEAAHFLM